MPKTRQQRMAEERAGHAPSPPQILADKPRVPTRTREKAPSANNTVAAGPVLPVAQSAAPSPGAPQALVHVWADQDRYVYDPTHELTIPSALVPELVIFIKKLRDHGSQNSATSSSSSATQVTPSLVSRQFAPIPQTSRTKPQVSGPSAPMAPQPTSTGVISPFQETSPMATRASLAGIEQPFQQVFGLTPPLDTRANVGSHPQELHRSLTPNDPLPAHIEAPFQKTSHPAQLTGIDQPVQKISQSVTPTLVVEQALKTSSKNDIVEKQALADQQIREVAQLNQTKPMPKKVSSSKSQTGASGAARRKRRARSGKPSAPAPIKQKLAPVPSDPETIHGLGLPSIFRKHRKLPAYTANGHVFYGKVAPSDDYLKFQDETPTSTDSSMANASKTQALQASGSSVPGRLIRPIRSVKRRFGFSPLTTISESSETTPPTQPANNRPIIRFPSRWLDRMNATKRKRWTSPTPSESIPNPKGKSYGLGEVEFYGNAEEDENEDKIAGQRPGKVRRTSQLQNFSSQEAANSGTFRPLTGQHSIIPKTPIPVTNAAGSFKVPSPCDSDWSDSESEHEASSQAAAVPPSTTNSANPGSTSRPKFRPNGYENWLKTATPAAAAAVELMEVNHTAAGQAFEAVAYSDPPPTSRPQFNALGDWLETVSPSVAAAIEQMDVDPDMAGAAFKRGLDNCTNS
ncbi:hypothetical protein MMC31_004870 [Peltigera leucophlebia]|nr:hypothetical protein [Peltigera leucophlebia]